MLDSVIVNNSVIPKPIDSKWVLGAETGLGAVCYWSWDVTLCTSLYIRAPEDSQSTHSLKIGSFKNDG